MDEEIITPANLDNDRGRRAILDYVLGNCIFAYDELCRINKELVQGMRLDSDTDINLDHLGAMNRMIQDYLIVRVAGLFDKRKHRTKGGADKIVSFEKLFFDNGDFKNIRKQEIIKYIIEQRNNFVAHVNEDHIENNFPITSKICTPNLRELLENLQKLLKSQAT